MRQARWLPPLLIFVSSLVAVPAAPACPNCKEAVAGPSGEASRLADGYSYSILIMAGMPFALFGTGAFVVARAVKRGVLPEL